MSGHRPPPSETSATAVIALPAAMRGCRDRDRDGHGDVALLAALTPIIAAHPLLTVATEQGGHVDPASVHITLLERDRLGDRLRLGVLAEEIVGGCSCGDAPYSAGFYAELTLRLDLPGGTGEIALVRD